MVTIICGCFTISPVTLLVEIMNESKFSLHNEFDRTKTKKTTINLPNCVVGWRNKMCQNSIEKNCLKQTRNSQSMTNEVNK